MSSSFDDSAFILTSSNSFPSMVGTQTTPTLTPTTLKNITECLAGQESELYHQFEHEHQAKFIPPDINFNAPVFRNNQQSQVQHQQQHQSLHGQGQENMCNNFLHSASDNDSARVSGDDDDDDDEDDESTSFSTGGYSHCPGDSASNDSQETYSTKGSTTRSSTGGNNRTHSMTRSITNGNNSSSNNNRSGSRAKSRSVVRKTREARNDEKLAPEEEHRRRLRRERNKQAAARCRKRRLDHTEELTLLTEELEAAREQMRKELQILEQEKEELEARTRHHLNSGLCHKNVSGNCGGSAVKSEGQQSLTTAMAKTRRPSSLPLGPGFASVTGSTSSSNNSTNNNSPAVTSTIASLSAGHNSEFLVPIQTPSNGLLLGFGGLTPLLDTPSAGGFMPPVSCGGQNRGQCVTSDSMVMSPDAPMKLVSL